MLSVASPAARLCDGVCQPCLSTTSKRSMGPEKALSAIGSSEQAEGSSMAVAAAAARRLSNEKMEPCDFILDRIFFTKRVYSRTGRTAQAKEHPPAGRMLSVKFMAASYG